jgi:hypothetical protein
VTWLRNVLNLARSNPVERGEYFWNERGQIRNAIGRGTDNNDTKRKTGDVLLVFEIAIHCHQGINQAACPLQESAVLGSRPTQSLHGGH